MQPGSGESHVNFELPQPPEGELAEDTSLEQLPSRSPENKPQSQSIQASSNAASSYALPSNAITVITDDSTVPQAGQSSFTGKDEDRIDKVWVEKAKSIIVRTKEDPFEQKNQLSKVKADYIKTRFNKTIKLDDAASK